MGQNFFFQWARVRRPHLPKNFEDGVSVDLLPLVCGVDLNHILLEVMVLGGLGDYLSQLRVHAAIFLCLFDELIVHFWHSLSVVFEWKVPAARPACM